MHPMTQALRDLSELDMLIVQTRDQLALYPKMLKKLTDAEDVERKRAEEAAAALQTARHQRRQGEKDVQTLREKIKKLLAQQNMVKTTRDYETLSHELEVATGEIDQLETRGLELLDEEERLTRVEKQAVTALARLERDHAEEKERIIGQIRDKQERLEKLNSEQARKLAELPDEWQQSYPLMNQRMPGTVAVPIPGGQCGGCHFALPPGTQQRVRAGKDLIRCDNCRRVLYDQ